MSRFAISSGLAGLVTAGLLAAPVHLRAADPKPVLRLTALASNIASTGRYNPQRMEIVIERWSTDQEHASLVEILTTKGSDALLDLFQKMKPRAGYIRTDTSLAWDIQFARQTALPAGGSRIFFATDRPMAFYEEGSGARSAQYEFMVGELRVDMEGKGEGKLVPAAKIYYDKGEKTIEIENYASEPVSLDAVAVEKK